MSGFSSNLLSMSSYVSDRAAREAPARIVALTEKFSSGAPLADLLAASRALEEQMEHLHDGKDWADTTCPLLQRLLVLTTTAQLQPGLTTPLAFKVSVARCMVHQLGHMWHYWHAHALPFITWVVQNLLLKNSLPEVKAGCALLTELVACTEERPQEPDAQQRSVNSEVTEAALERLEVLVDLERSRFRCSDAAEAQELAEELVDLLQRDGEPEPLDRVMGRVAAFFTATTTTAGAQGGDLLDLTSKLPVAVREDLLDINCELFPYVDRQLEAAEAHARSVAAAARERAIIPGIPGILVNKSCDGGAAAAAAVLAAAEEEMEMEKEKEEAVRQAARVGAAVDIALAPSAQGGPSLFACVLRILRRCPEVRKNLQRPCQQKVVDFAVRLAMGVLVAAAAADEQFERAQRTGNDGDGDGGDDALYTVLCAFKLHRFHLYEGNDVQIFHHIDRVLRRGARSAAWAVAVKRTGPIYDDTGKYIDF